MSSLAQFRAVYCSGLFIPDAATVSALALLFEKVHLPNNIEIATEFSKKYRIRMPAHVRRSIEIKKIEGPEDPFANLTAEERKTARSYLAAGIDFSLRYAALFPDIFETKLFEEGTPVDVKLVKKGRPGELNTYNVSWGKDMILTGDDHETFPRLLEDGYVPVVGKFQPDHIALRNLDQISAKELATLLAMKSVEIIFPRTKAVHPEIILEARERLADNLPPFWSSMLKLSTELKSRIDQKVSVAELIWESQEIVDTVVRPALIDLQQKMIKEKKEWFYKILSPIQKGIKLFIGNPPLTQQQLLTNALVLGSDVTMTALDHMNTIEALKRESGLTFLLEAADVFEKNMGENDD